MTEVSEHIHLSNVCSGANNLCSVDTVAGCPDLEIPSDTWMKREEDRLKVKCNSSTQTWFLICSDNKWVGEVGNCTLKVGYTGKQGSLAIYRLKIVHANTGVYNNIKSHYYEIKITIIAMDQPVYINKSFH